MQTGNQEELIKMAQNYPFSIPLLCPWQSHKIRPKRSLNLLNRPQHSRLGPSKHANSRKSCVLSTVIWLESPRVLNIALEVPAILIRKGFPLCQMIVHFSQWQAQVLNPWHGMKVYISDSQKWAGTEWESPRDSEASDKALFFPPALRSIRI